MDKTNQDHFESSKKKMEVLFPLGAGEELEGSLNKLICFQIAKYHTNIKQIHHFRNTFLCLRKDARWKNLFEMMMTHGIYLHTRI